MKVQLRKGAAIHTAPDPNSPVTIPGGVPYDGWQVTLINPNNNSPTCYTPTDDWWNTDSGPGQGTGWVSRQQAMLVSSAPPSPSSPSLSLSISNASPAVTTSVTIQAASSDPNYNTVRVTAGCGSPDRYELGAPSVSYSWDTSGCPTGTRTITAEARTTADTNWVSPLRTTQTITLLPPPLVAPTNLVGQVLSCHSVQLTWQENSSAQDGFQVFRNDVQIGLVGPTGTTAQYTDLMESTSYRFYVKAYQGTTGLASNVISVTTPACDAASTWLALLTSPTGASLPGFTTTFSWTPGTGALEYWLDVGLSVGGGEFYSASTGTAQSVSVRKLPTDGTTTVHVRLHTRFAGGWQYRDYTFTAFKATGMATLTTPTPGATLPGSIATFSWTTGVGASEYWVDIGTTPGGYDVYGGLQGLNQSLTVTNLPLGTGKVYVRLYTHLPVDWAYIDYTYSEATQAQACSAVAFTVSPSTSAMPGTAVTLTATSTGCGGTPQYRYWVQNPAGSWSIAQDYSPASTFSWNTSNLPVGAYRLSVTVRSQTSTLDREAEAYAYYTLGNGCTSASISPSPASPANRGTVVTVTGGSTGCSGTPQYRYWVQDTAGLWTMVQDYSPATSFSWNTSGLPSGTYRLAVTVRSQASTQEREQDAYAYFTLQ